MSDLKDLFEAHCISIPEDKVDVLEDMATKITKLEEQLNEAVDKNIQTEKVLNEYRREEILAEVADDLSYSQVEKLKTLTEAVEFDDEDSYKDKVKTIKESYFTTNADIKEADIEFDQPLNEEVEEKVVDQTMSRYAKALSRIEIGRAHV